MRYTYPAQSAPSAAIPHPPPAAPWTTDAKSEEEEDEMRPAEVDVLRAAGGDEAGRRADDRDRFDQLLDGEHRGEDAKPSRESTIVGRQQDWHRHHDVGGGKDRSPHHRDIGGAGGGRSELVGMQGEPRREPRRDEPLDEHDGRADGE